MLKKTLLVLLTYPAYVDGGGYIILVLNFRNITSNRIERRIDYSGIYHESYNGVDYTRWHYGVYPE